MRLLLKVLVFILSFTIEITVKAQSIALPEQTHLLLEPENCLELYEVCHMMTKASRKYTLQMATSNVVMGPATLISKLQIDHLVLVDGELWITSPDKVVVETEYADIEIKKAEAWIYRNKGEVVVRSLKGNIIVRGRGEKEELTVPPAFEIEISKVTKKGKSWSSIPKVLDLKDHLRRWARLYPKSKDEFSVEAKKFAPTWKAALQKTSEFHTQLAQREIAKAQKEEQERLRRIKLKQEEQRKLRELFRRKLMLDGGE